MNRSIYIFLFTAIMVFNVSNCFTTYSFSKPEMNQSIEVKSNFPILLYNGSNDQQVFEFSNDRILKKNPEKNEGVIVKFQNEKLVSSNFKILNALSYLTFCIIPCIYESQYEFDIDFDSYVIKQEEKTTGYWPLQRTYIEKVVVPQKTLSSEKVIYSVNQIGFVFAYEDITSFESIFKKLNKNDSDDEEKRKLSSKIRMLNSYLNSRIASLEKSNSEESKKNDIEIEAKLSRVSNNDCKELFSLHGKIDEVKKEMKMKVWEKFELCINSKTKKFALKKYPFLKDFIDKEIFFWNETSEYFVHELFHSSFLSIIPETKYKLRDEEFYFTKISPAKFNLNIQNGRELIVIEFEKKEKNVYCNSIKSGSEINPPEWQDLVKKLFKKLYIYPQEDDHWDWELISKY